jgi:hypothetical protein
MNPDLEDALNEAVRAQFVHLFGVLVKDVSTPDLALQRFKKGLEHLALVEEAVAKLISEKK